MDFVHSSYYRINERFLYYLGQWPLQTPRERQLYTSITLLFAGSICIPQIIKFVESLGNLNGMIRCFPAFIVHARCITRYLNSRINAKKMSTLTSRMQDAWDRSSADHERGIVESYAERGKLASIVYIGIVFVTMVIYLSLPIIPAMLDVVSPLNRSRNRILLDDTEYFIDLEEHYVFALVHACISKPVVVAIIVANECMLGVYVNHACGIFATLGARLESLGNGGLADEKSEMGKHLIKREGEIYDKIIDCIKIHKDALGVIGYGQWWCGAGSIIEGILDDKYLPILGANIGPTDNQKDQPII